MKIVRLEIKNVKKIKDMAIDIVDINHAIFFGKVKMGKTTILDCVRWTFGGEKIIPNDVIKHGETEASIKVFLDSFIEIETRIFLGRIKEEVVQKSTVSIYQHNKDLGTRAELKPEGGVRTFLLKMANEIQLNDNWFTSKSHLEQTRFFLELSEIDFTAEDKNIADAKKKAQELRAEVRAFGEISVTPVNKVDTAILQKQKDEIEAKNKEQRAKYEANYNKLVSEISQTNSNIEKAENALIDFDHQKKEVEKQIQELNQKLQGIITMIEEGKKYLKENTKKDLPKFDFKGTDTSDIDKQLTEAATKNVEYDKYQEALKRQLAKETKERELKAQTDIQKINEAAKMKKLEQTKLPFIKFVEQDEQIVYKFDDTLCFNLSDSQKMRLTQEICEYKGSLLNLLLIDRGESLGIENIQKYIDKANQTDTQILMTVVGEKPDSINKGVYVINEGQII